MSLFVPSKKTEASDAILLEKFRETEELIFLGELYQRHSEMVYYVCLRYFQDAEKSKDAVMQIFEHLINKVNKQPIQDFPKWLYVVSKNHCLMDLRASKNKIEVPLADFVEFSLSLHQDEYAQDKEQQLTQLERCMDSLPEKQKVSIDLFFLHEKCYLEVVETTGYSMKEVKSYIQNGKRNLKNCMDKAHE